MNLVFEKKIDLLTGPGKVMLRIVTKLLIVYEKVAQYFSAHIL